MIATALIPMVESGAQSPGMQSSGYQTPNFPGMGMPAGGGVQRIPAFPASPLAGGPAAAQGGEFVDVQGRPIVLPANYCQSSPGGGCYDGGYCGPPGGGFGDPMAVDFGGYGQDQCGPHFFDVSADLVFLQSQEIFKDTGAFGAVGPLANAPRILDPANFDDDYEPGWRIAARYDIGALAVIEGTYMGLYDIGFSQAVVSEAVSIPPGQPNQLVSAFSNYGQNPIAGLDQGELYVLDYQADLQSTEISYRRYWVGHNPRVSGTFLLGARYIRFTEDLDFVANAFIPSTGVNGISSRSWESENDMVGFQFGGDGWYSLRQGLRFGGEAKAGVYNNHYKFTNAGDFAPGAQVGANPAPADFNEVFTGDQVSFAAEVGLSFVADILPSWSVRGGYQVLYLNSIASTGGNVVFSVDGLSNTTNIASQDHALFHGFNGGVEYAW